MDTDSFTQACNIVLNRQRLGTEGIGTLSEKTIHSVLKQYLSQDLRCQEIKIGPFFADVLVGHHIYEIQTRQFRHLRKKLDFFLPAYPVTVVYPISLHNRIRWIDPETGAISEVGRSRKAGHVLQVFSELYQIRSVLSHPNFSLKLVLMDTEEYRLLDGRPGNRKQHATKCDKLPTALIAEYDLAVPADYMMLLPSSLPDTFTARELASCAGIPVSLAQTALLLLSELNVVQRTGKQGNAYLYEL